MSSYSKIRILHIEDDESMHGLIKCLIDSDEAQDITLVWNIAALGINNEKLKIDMQTGSCF